MSRRLLAALVASVAVAGAVVVSVSALQPGESLVRSRADGSQAQTFTATAGTECWRRGDWVIRPQSVPLSACTPTTTVPPTTAPPPTTVPPTGQFVETFDGNTGLDRFDYNVWNRHDGGAGATVSADHDLACGDASTQRTVYGSDPSSSFYVCRDHLMTAVGDWAGYSVGWFSPKQTFSGARTVSWDVNITDLGARQWWEVMIVPASWSSGVPGCEHCAVQTWLSPDPANLPGYPTSAIVVGNGAFGNTVNIHAGGRDRYSGWQPTCGQWGLFAAECSSKAIRVAFKITDNGNGTISVNYGGNFVETFAGSFPAEFRVVFKDHNYTPDKDGTPVGHTWHWDNIAIT